MTDATVIAFDPDRRRRREAQRNLRRAVESAYSTLGHIIAADLVGRAFDVADAVMRDGMPTSSMGEPGSSGGGHGDPTAAAVLQREPLGSLLAECDGEGGRLDSASTYLFRMLGAIVAQGTPPAEADAAGAGHCQRCSRWVAGTSSDRIRSGWCPACYQAWRRAGCPDRTDWNRTDDDAPPAS